MPSRLNLALLGLTAAVLIALADACCCSTCQCHVAESTCASGQYHASCSKLGDCCPQCNHLERLPNADDIIPEAASSVELLQDELGNVGAGNKVALGSESGASASGPASGGVETIIPEFMDKDLWVHTDDFWRERFNGANEHYKKINAKEFHATNALRKELAIKAEKAYEELKAVKEKMQKKYAKDDPVDYGKHYGNSGDIADEKRYKSTPVKLGGTGSWGASGTPGKRKWYSDGVISTDGWVDTKGHYLLGAHRRRVGAGFGRRRTGDHDAKESPRVAPPSGAEVKSIVKGHAALAEAFGDPKKADEKKAEDAKAEPQVMKDAGISAKKYGGDIDDKKPTVAEAEAAKEAALAAKGEVEAEAENITPEERKMLNVTKAGMHAVMDESGHFTEAVNERVAGSEVTNALEGKGVVTSEEAY